MRTKNPSCSGNSAATTRTFGCLPGFVNMALPWVAKAAGMLSEIEKSSSPELTRGSVTIGPPCGMTRTFRSLVSVETFAIPAAVE